MWMETSLKQFALGESLVASPHSVVGCLPTMADVRAYEEKETRVWSALEGGYPRFVEHVWVRELKSFYMERAGLEITDAALLRGEPALASLADLLGGDFRSLEVEPGLFLVWLEGAADSKALMKYIQHTGCGISSREAEDWLVRHGLQASVFEEATYAGDADAAVRSEMARLTGTKPTEIWPCASGMNAFYSAFRAIQSVQRARGRRRWLQLGWVYVDSGSILEKYLGVGEALEICHTVENTESVLEAIANCGEELAALVVECPSNPLIKSCDLARIAAAVQAQGGIVLLDPTIASVYAVDVLKYADVLATSLTKYAGHGADLMTGALVLNPDSSHAASLRPGLEQWHLKPYARDLARLAQSMQDAPAKVAAMQANARRLRVFLEAHPSVERVHASTGAAFDAIAKEADCVVPLFSIVLKGSMERFYDAVTTMKGPSFGADRTILCPFMYLAHYDLVTSQAGRSQLQAAGIEPDLIRIAVGTEPYEALEAVFAAALEA
jgi:cystathionine gamma-synthase